MTASAISTFNATLSPIVIASEPIKVPAVAPYTNFGVRCQIDCFEFPVLSILLPSVFISISYT